MKTITRRTALAASATLPLLPVSAFATPADPILAAYAEWQTMRAHYEQVLANWCALERQHGNKAPEVDAYVAGPVERETDRICDMEGRIAKMVATTPAGLAAQLRVAVRTFEYRGDTDNEEDRFVLSALAAAENFAEASS